MTFTASAIGPTDRRGTEFVIDTFAKCLPSWGPVAAMAPDGRFVVAWTSEPAGGGNGNAYFRCYGADGSPIGPEVPVSADTGIDRISQSVVMDADGDFAVVWDSYAQGDGDHLDVYRRCYHADGTPATEELRVNTQTANMQFHAEAAMDASGNFAVVWDSFLPDLSDAKVYGRRFLADGSPVGGEFAIDPLSAAQQVDPVVAMDAGGDFIVAWHGTGPGSSGLDVYGRRFQNDWTPLGLTPDGPEFFVPTSTLDDQTVGSVAMNPDGDFVVAWNGKNQDGDGWGVFAQRFLADGTRLGGEFPINTATAGEQAWAAVTMDARGDFVVAWSTTGGGDLGIFARQFRGPHLHRVVVGLGQTVPEVDFGNHDTQPLAVANILPAPGSTITTSSINIDITFSEPVQGVDATDLVLGGTAAGSALVGDPLNTAGNTWRFPVKWLMDGTLDLSLAPDADDIEDLAGHDLANVTWSYATVGTRVEGFETGDFSRFPWQRPRAMPTGRPTPRPASAAVSAPVQARSATAKRARSRWRWTPPRATSVSSAGSPPRAATTTSASISMECRRARGLGRWLGGSSRTR